MALKPDALILNMMILADQVHHWHWMTKGPGSYALHAALGDLYGFLRERMDVIAEASMGNRIFEPKPKKITFSLPELSKAVPTIRSFADSLNTAGYPGWLANEVQGIQGELYQYLFKLERLA